MKVSEEKLLIQPEGVEFIDPEDIGSEPEETTEEEAEDEGEFNDDDFGDDFW